MPVSALTVQDAVQLLEGTNLHGTGANAVIFGCLTSQHNTAIAKAVLSGGQIPVPIEQCLFDRAGLSDEAPLRIVDVKQCELLKDGC